MNILGINSYTHDLGAAICIDGEIKYAVEEERLSRVKHHPGIEVEGSPPRLAVNYVLHEAGLELSDIDRIVHVGWPGDNFMKLDIIRTRFREYAKELDPTNEKTSFISHHLAHAASTYYASGYEHALVAAIDGVGDWISSSLWLGKGTELKKVDEYFLESSLGFMYSRAAKLLGLGGFGYGEGKLTALAAYGKQILDFPPVSIVENGRYSLTKDYYEHFKKFERKNLDAFTSEQKNFATTIQTILEDTVIAILTHANGIHGEDNLALAGGVSLNCRMNGRLSLMPWVKNMFIQPGANDSGICIGAAYAGSVELGNKPKKLESIYLGPNLTNENIENYIKKNKLNAEYVSEPHKLGAALINQGNVVAWVQGRLEFGPRALGHRSLLGDPRSVSVKDRMNEIKQREFWRPVAPAAIYSEKKYFDYNQATEHMTKAVKMNSLAMEEIPGGIHVDGTARVQFVKDNDDLFYKLIKSFEEITSIPAVLNTSLNSKNEPLCNSMDDVVRFFYSTPTDHLVLGNWWIKKR